MRPLPKSSKEYFDELKRRGNKSKITKSYQLTGLEIASILDDQEHKGLYMKLAKQLGDHTVMTIAKSVAEKKDITRKGAYFMRVLKGRRKAKTKKTKK